MNRHALVLLAFLPLIAVAQTAEIPKTTLDDLSRDLAQLQKAVLAAQAKQQEIKADVGYSLPDKVTVTNTTFLRAGTTEKSATVVKALMGDTFSVVDKSVGWYAVKLDKPINGLTTAWLKTAVAVPTATQPSESSASTTDQIFSELTERAARFKNTYRNNPYVSVTGFTVGMVPPSISIVFEFKK